MIPMKVLWITYDIFPEAKSLIAQRAELKGTGGWMLGLANSLIENSATEIEISVASISSLVKELTILKGEHITHYVIPFGKGPNKYNKEHELALKTAYETARPDIVHIHGTESSLGLSFLNACPEAKTVVSIQGLTSVYHRYFNCGISFWQILKNFTLYTLLKGFTIIHQKRIFKAKGRNEIAIIKKAKHVIGRTGWDKAHCWAINPNAEYHFCNETLRDEFYTSGCWEYKNCNKHTIFLSQAWYPVKGLHMLLKAMPLILREYPDTVVRIGGTNITSSKNIKERITISNYGKIISGLIKKYHLENNVQFINRLNATEMKEEYLKCNVFVCPSTIENSPNSLGEAQILGVPCVSSFVGGVSDMTPNDACGKVYRFEEVEMLAKCIVDTFRESETFDNTIMRKVASARHSRETNSLVQYNIYKYIIDNCN